MEAGWLLEVENCNSFEKNNKRNLNQHPKSYAPQMYNAASSENEVSNADYKAG